MSDERSAYTDFARELVDTTVLADPWIDGQPRFRSTPEVLSAPFVGKMYRAAEEVAAVYDELTRIVARTPALLQDFFALTPLQSAMWLASSPRWHGIARADVFVTKDGDLAFAELNCDTPTGEPEAVELSRLAARSAPSALRDPNADMQRRFVAMVDAVATHAKVNGAAVGIIYPTDMTEDLSLVRLYGKWMKDRGRSVVIGSPYNLTFEHDQLCLFGEPIGIALRHYKTDWWGERASPWDDEHVADVAPLHAPLAAAMAAMLGGSAAFVNPFGSVLPQNKRAMAFMWEHMESFSLPAKRTIERYVPFTSRLESMHASELRAEPHQWVLKADYGAEGNEVVVGRAVSNEIWLESLARARPGRWIAQRYFDAESTASGEITNYGIYVITGEAAGIYLRTQAGATDDHALSVPVLVSTA